MIFRYLATKIQNFLLPTTFPPNFLQKTAKGNKKYYIQSAYELSTEMKREQELKSLKRINDSFQKIVIVKDDIMPYRDEKGIYYTGLFQFLTGEKVIV